MKVFSCSLPFGKRLLPPTNSKILMSVVIPICTVIAYFFVMAFSNEGIQAKILVVVFFLPLGLGLWFLKEPVRLLISAIIMILIIFAPIGVINPFVVMDNPNPDLPDAWELAIEIYPWVLAGLLVVLY